jgi:hypothetical protein
VETRLPLIACNLGPGDQRARLEDWRSLLARARSRADVNRGVRYVFDPSVAEPASIRRLAAAERECCSFLQFEFDEDDEGFAMTVTTEPAALDALRFVFT